MTFSIYQASIPVLTRAFDNLSHLLGKAEEHAALKKVDLDVFFNARLAPDMYSLGQQIQRASDTAKGCAARLAGIDNPSFPDNEISFPDLHARIAKTVEFLKAVTEAQLADAADRKVTLNLGSRAVDFTGASYLLGFALPNFFFHITTTYDILRHNGVPVGKLDYLGKF